jgi:SAM-dependent methyltransferase
MLRGIAKGSLLGAFGWMPGGAGLYQTLTRDWMGTQATHVDKQARVWPTYAGVWSTFAGLELEGLRVWVHGGGWTPFPFVANYLLTGDAGVVTNVDGRMLDRYLARAVNGVLECRLPSSEELDRRRPDVERLRWYEGVAEAVAAIGGELHEDVDVAAVPLESTGVDLSHSGGTLEHLAPDKLRAFLGEAFRVLRPGGVMSHVFDHRDHLHHADPSWPYLAHLRLSPAVYRVLCGNPLLYHNRLLPFEVMALFDSAGFEKIVVRRMALPDHTYVDSEEEVMGAAPGIERPALARKFRSASEADLRTAAAHYIYRKPLH